MNDTTRSIYQIQKIRYIKSYYDQTVHSVTVVYELSEKGILEYCMEQGSRKRLDRSFTKVDSVDMRNFMDDLQSFVQGADITFKRVDDCIHKVQFIYEGDHKEIFDLDIGTIDREDSIIKRICCFILEHQRIY